MKTINVITTALAAAGNVDAFWRMPCRSRTGLARLDPLVDPGSIADHVHAIHGGGNFGMTTTYDDLVNSSGSKNCTSCEVLEDKSAYWTPSLHFVYPNGTMVVVPQIGGMLAYYLMYLDNLEPFPEGFRLLAGNRYQRNFTGPFPDIEQSLWPTNPTDQFFLEQRALGFNCLNYGATPEPSLYRHQFPDRAYMDAHCKDGLRIELAFPSCGNGQLDSPDHRSHVAYPSLVKEGNCPKGFDHHYPFLFYETIWATNAFAGQAGEFVLSHGDPVGTGYHGDFIMGWKSADFLGQAIKTCTNPSGQIQDCPIFTLQDDAKAAQCTFDVPDILKDDKPEGPREGLARGVPIQYGPELATAYPVIGKPSAKASQPASSKPAPPKPTLSIPALSIPSLSIPAVPSPSKSANGLGGLLFGAVKSGGPLLGLNRQQDKAAVTSAPPVSAAKAAKIVTTSYLTRGNEVVEVVVEQVDVTVTASSAPTDANHKRHFHQHLHGGIRH